jgi:hypothetical protein
MIAPFIAASVSPSRDKPKSKTRLRGRVLDFGQIYRFEFGKSYLQ